MAYWGSNSGAQQERSRARRRVRSVLVDLEEVGRDIAPSLTAMQRARLINVVDRLRLVADGRDVS
jgi:hypothetical protein